MAVTVELTVNGTTAAPGRYLTWAPSPASLRIVNADGAQTPVAVRLLTAPGSVGRHWFRTAPGAAPTIDLSLALDPAGAPSPFFLSGRFPSASRTDGDAVLQVRLKPGTQVISSTPTMVRIRKDAEKLTTAERNRFLSALALLNNGGLGIFRDFRGSHTQVSSLEAHGRDGFWPWHRAFLLDLERELQRLDRSVTLPYWRFDQPAPKLFTPAFIGGPGPVAVIAPTNPLVAWRTDGQPGIPRTPLFDPKTSRATDPNFGPVSTEVETTGDTGPYGPLRSVFEGDPHGLAHTSFSGLISSIPTAARDPLFFLLHCNVDRLWAKWQWIQERFDGATNASYRFRGKAGDPGATRIGHNAKDTMWPWNNVTGTPRPATAPRHPIRASPAVTGPAAAPTVGEMIDFQGHTGAARRLGFDFDDVPFEA